MACHLCQERPVPPDYGSTRRCAFDESGNFVRDNWMCETMREIRLSYEVKWTGPGDETTWVIPGPNMVGAIDSSGNIVLATCKNRGQVGAAYLLNSDNGAMQLTLAVAEALLSESGFVW